MTTTSHEATRPKVLCPVAEVAGDKHYFTPGTGEVVEWHIMGDPRTEAEVCSSCAKCE